MEVLLFFKSVMLQTSVGEDGNKYIDSRLG